MSTTNLVTLATLQALREKILSEIRDEEHPANSRWIQFYGEATPAERFGGEWAIDDDYAGRVLVSSGTGFALGSTGGQEQVKHDHDSGSLYAMAIPRESNEIAFKWKKVDVWQSQIILKGTSRDDSIHEDMEAAADVGGRVGQSNISIMQPYKVVAVWKRIA